MRIQGFSFVLGVWASLSAVSLDQHWSVGPNQVPGVVLLALLLIPAFFLALFEGDV